MTLLVPCRFFSLSFVLCFQVIASVLRNLSWRADVNSKKTLREVGSVRALMGCALEVQKVRFVFFCSLSVL